MRAYESYRRRQARREFIRALFWFMWSVLGLTITVGAALIGSMLFGDDKPFTNFFHFIVIAYMVIGCVITCHGIVRIARD